jgi:two-component system NtrC family sensor kinase
MRLLRTVSFRVSAGTVILLLAAFSLFAYSSMHFTAGEMTAQAVASANRISDFVVASTHYSMLLNRKQDVYQMVQTIGAERGVVGIRIYNKRGQITFSTDPAENGRLVDLHADACVACHDSERPLEALPQRDRVRVYRDPGGDRVVGVIQPVRNQPACSATGCHQSPAERTVLGVFDVRMSLAGVDAAIGGAQRRTVAGAAAGFVLVAIASWVFLRWTVGRPIRALDDGTAALARGDLDHEIPVRSDDDLGQLATSFNGMTRSLREALEENRRWAQTLEDRVREKSEELQRINRQVLQVEKMASLGTLAASVAHELNNPLSGILTYAKLQAKRLRRESPDAPWTRTLLVDLDMIVHETERCGNIVRNLLLFARKQEGEFHRASLRESIERAAQLLGHHLAMANVTLETACEPPDVAVLGDEGQIQQALVALLVNATEAMPDGGTVRVTARRGAGGEVRLAVEDTGPGIAPDDLPHIFEPFFTTKPQGQGVGLGLSVVYGIVQRHHATVEALSEPGRGATFVITFPPPDRVVAPPAPAHTAHGARA